MKAGSRADSRSSVYRRPEPLSLGPYFSPGRGGGKTRNSTCDESVPAPIPLLRGSGVYSRHVWRLSPLPAVCSSSVQVCSISFPQGLAFPWGGGSTFPHVRAWQFCFLWRWQRNSPPERHFLDILEFSQRKTDTWPWAAIISPIRIQLYFLRGCR